MNTQAILCSAETNVTQGKMRNFYGDEEECEDTGRRRKVRGKKRETRLSVRSRNRRAERDKRDGELRDKSRR